MGPGDPKLWGAHFSTTPVRTPPRSLDDMDGRGWVANASRVSVGGAGRSGGWLRLGGLAGLVSRVCVYVDWRGWEV